MMMIGRAGGVALLEKEFATDDYSKEDLQYVADVLRHCSRRFIMENTLRHQQPYTDFSRIIRVKSEYIKEGQKIMDDKKVARINELYHKSKAEGLTPEELKEQQILRKEYIDSFKRNLRGQLNNISIKEKDGSITNLGEKFGNKKGN